VVQRQVDEHFAVEARYWADVYDRSRVTSLIYTKRQEIALNWIDELGLPSNSPVLEIGCGAGRLAAKLADRGLRVMATDSNPAMIQLARRNAIALGVCDTMSSELADAHELPFRAEAFQVVVALGVLPWLHTMRMALSEMYRVLRPEGYSILTCDNRLRLDYFLDPRNNFILRPLRQRLSMPLVGVGLLKESPNLQSNLLSRGQFASLLGEAGLDVLALAPCGYGPFTFFGRRILPTRAGVVVQRAQQQLAEGGAPILRSSPNQYVALCRKQTRPSSARSQV
jgi:ubiquinone/menaquinone biosynthesis C-methylase UbiE